MHRRADIFLKHSSPRFKTFLSGQSCSKYRGQFNVSCRFWFIPLLHSNIIQIYQKVFEIIVQSAAIYWQAYRRFPSLLKCWSSFHFQLSCDSFSRHYVRELQYQFSHRRNREAFLYSDATALLIGCSCPDYSDYRKRWTSWSDLVALTVMDVGHYFLHDRDPDIWSPSNAKAIAVSTYRRRVQCSASRPTKTGKWWDTLYP